MTYYNSKQSGQFLDLSSGIPSHDRFNAIINALDPKEFEPLLLDWLTDLHEITAGQVIAIDGKTLRRSYYLCELPATLPDASRWAGLQAIGMSINNTFGRKAEELAIRYYIVSKVLTGEAFAGAVREHWGIENSCHWQLDVTFGEDQCRIRKGHGDENFSTLRRTALSLLKKETTAKCGVKNKRLAAGWDDQYMEKVVFGK